MKLYYSPGACSLATHIALLEAGIDSEFERVDLKHKTTTAGADFNLINTKGYVPALVIDGGEVLTENIAVLDWIATQAPALGLPGPLGRTRLLETLAYVSTEIHKSFKPFFTGANEEEKAKAEMLINKRLRWLVSRKAGRYLFGDQPTVADFYLFVMLRWASRLNISIPEQLGAYQLRMMERPKVQSAIEFEEVPVKRVGNM